MPTRPPAGSRPAPARSVEQASMIWQALLHGISITKSRSKTISPRVRRNKRRDFHTCALVKPYRSVDLEEFFVP